jgi:hypothetical protein
MLEPNPKPVNDLSPAFGRLWYSSRKVAARRRAMNHRHIGRNFD